MAKIIPTALRRRKLSNKRTDSWNQVYLVRSQAKLCKHPFYTIWWRVWETVEESTTKQRKENFSKVRLTILPNNKAVLENKNLSIQCYLPLPFEVKHVLLFFLLLWLKTLSKTYIGRKSKLSSSNKIKVGTRGKNIKIGIEARTIEEYCILLSYMLPQSTCLMMDGTTFREILTTWISNQENAQTMPMG